MKIIKMRVKKVEGAGVTKYTYPETYDAQKVKWGPFYEGALPEKIEEVRQRGLDDEYIIFGVDDKDASQFLSSNAKLEKGFTFAAQEITKEEALVDGNAWTMVREKITDQSKVIAILAKIARDEVLTQTEKDSLDPDKPEIGINKSKSFEESINAFLGK